MTEVVLEAVVFEAVRMVLGSIMSLLERKLNCHTSVKDKLFEIKADLILTGAALQVIKDMNPSNEKVHEWVVMTDNIVSHIRIVLDELPAREEGKTKKIAMHRFICRGDVESMDLDKVAKRLHKIAKQSKRVIKVVKMPRRSSLSQNVLVDPEAAPEARASSMEFRSWYAFSDENPNDI